KDLHPHRDEPPLHVSLAFDGAVVIRDMMCRPVTKYLMKTLAWLTDPHLNFLGHEAIDSFCASLAEQAADAFLITGDIGEAPNVAVYLNILDNHLARPLYFVLGNHDFYRGSIGSVREN